MESRIDLRRLQHYFSSSDIEWKPVRFTKDRVRAMAVPYVTNRAIMDRLDMVCGPENWRNEFQQGPDGGVLCGLSIRISDEWVTKWDGASNTDVAAVKGGLSASMRRAAVQWGIGRYLYRLPAQWMAVDDKGRFVHAPSVPQAFHPGYSIEADDTPSLKPFSVAKQKSPGAGRTAKSVRRMARAS